MMSNNVLNNDQPFSLLVATPSHRGVFCSDYMMSVLALQQHCLIHGVGFQLKTALNISNIDRARNLLASDFLESGTATHMLFVDDDMGFNPAELIRMFDYRDDADVVAAMYPGKSINWQRIKEIVRANPEIDASELERISGNFANMYFLPEGEFLRVGDQPVPAVRMPTGLMLISRGCLQRLVDNDVAQPISQKWIDANQHEKGVRYEFFRSTITETGNSLGEDYFFCDLVRNNGGSILGCPWVRTTHTGTYSFKGDLPRTAQYLT